MNTLTPEQLAAIEARAAKATPFGFYVASRASIPERSAMWREWRSRGWLINSTWIDEAGEGQTADFGELWQRIHQEIAVSADVVLYAEPDDFPLKGALIEVGIALGLGKAVWVVLPGVDLESRSMRPVGSWLAHPLVKIAPDLRTVFYKLEGHPAHAPDLFPSPDDTPLMAAALRRAWEEIKEWERVYELEVGRLKDPLWSIVYGHADAQARARAALGLDDGDPLALRST